MPVAADFDLNNIEEEKFTKRIRYVDDKFADLHDKNDSLKIKIWK